MEWWKMEDGRWRMEDGGWKLEDGGWKIEIRCPDPSTRAPALAGGSCSGFRPAGVPEGVTGLPVGLHKEGGL